MVYNELKEKVKQLSASPRYYLIYVFFLLTIVSCKDTYEMAKFEPVEFETVGIVLTTADNGYKYTGLVHTNGAKIIITGKGKNESYARVERLIIDGEIIKKQDKSPIYSGDWGDIYQLTHKVPYVTEINISPNETSKTREFEIQLGFGYQSSTIRLTQLSGE